MNIFPKHNKSSTICQQPFLFSSSFTRKNSFFLLYSPIRSSYDVHHHIIKLIKKLQKNLEVIRLCLLYIISLIQNRKKLALSWRSCVWNLWCMDTKENSKILWKIKFNQKRIMECEFEGTEERNYYRHNNQNEK